MCQDTAPCPRRLAMQPPTGDFFGLMTQRLASEGGLIAETALRERWRRQGRPRRELDALLSRDGLCSLSRGRQRWWPAFQFQADGCSVRPDVAVIAEELAGGMDGAEILAWFCCSNAALDGETPIACLRTGLRTGLPAVLDAARLDRFIGSA